MVLNAFEQAHISITGNIIATDIKMYQGAIKPYTSQHKGQQSLISKVVPSQIQMAKVIVSSKNPAYNRCRRLSKTLLPHEDLSIRDCLLAKLEESLLLIP